MTDLVERLNDNCSCRKRQAAKVYCLDAEICDLNAEAADTIEAQARKIEKLEGALGKERRRATDAEYLNRAYRNMLGESGLKVAKKWESDGVTRVHFDWGLKADELTGEERAELILSIEKSPKTLMEDIDSQPPRAALGETE